MSKQIRIDDSAYEWVKQIARKSNKQQSVVTSAIIEVFGQLLERLEPGDRFLIEDDSQRQREIVLPFGTNKNKVLDR